jgi:hypothetical protein
LEGQGSHLLDILAYDATKVLVGDCIEADACRSEPGSGFNVDGIGGAKVVEGALWELHLTAGDWSRCLEVLKAWLQCVDGASNAKIVDDSNASCMGRLTDCVQVLILDGDAPHQISDTATLARSGA